MEAFLGTMTDNMRRLYMDIMASVKNISYEAYVYMFGKETKEAASLVGKWYSEKNIESIWEVFKCALQ